jgi:hypothetical protein
VVQLVDRLLVGERPQDGSADVARQLLSEEEDENAQQEERDDREAEPLEEKTRDRIDP